MMNLKKLDPLTIALLLGLAAVVWYKKNGKKNEAYCSACMGK